jgi:hypothetical protein
MKTLISAATLVLFPIFAYGYETGMPTGQQPLPKQLENVRKLEDRKTFSYYVAQKVDGNSDRVPKIAEMQSFVLQFIVHRPELNQSPQRQGQLFMDMAHVAHRAYQQTDRDLRNLKGDVTESMAMKVTQKAIAQTVEEVSGLTRKIPTKTVPTAIGKSALNIAIASGGTYLSEVVREYQNNQEIRKSSAELGQFFALNPDLNDPSKIGEAIHIIYTNFPSSRAAIDSITGSVVGTTVAASAKQIQSHNLNVKEVREREERQARIEKNLERNAKDSKKLSKEIKDHNQKAIDRNNQLRDEIAVNNQTLSVIASEVERAGLERENQIKVAEINMNTEAERAWTSNILTVASQMGGNPRSIAAIGAFANAAITVNHVSALLNQAGSGMTTALASGNVVGAILGIFAAFGPHPPSDLQIMLEQMQALSDQITEFRNTTMKALAMLDERIFNLEYRVTAKLDLLLNNTAFSAQEWRSLRADVASLNRLATLTFQWQTDNSYQSPQIVRCLPEIYAPPGSSIQLERGTNPVPTCQTLVIANGLRNSMYISQSMEDRKIDIWDVRHADVNFPYARNYRRIGQFMANNKGDIDDHFLGEPFRDFTVWKDLPVGSPIPVSDPIEWSRVVRDYLQLSLREGFQPVPDQLTQLKWVGQNLVSYLTSLSSNISGTTAQLDHQLVKMVDERENEIVKLAVKIYDGYMAGPMKGHFNPATLGKTKAFLQTSRYDGVDPYVPRYNLGGEGISVCRDHLITAYSRGPWRVPPIIFNELPDQPVSDLLSFSTSNSTDSPVAIMPTENFYAWKVDAYFFAADLLSKSHPDIFGESFFKVCMDSGQLLRLAHKRMVNNFDLTKITFEAVYSFFVKFHSHLVDKELIILNGSVRADQPGVDVPTVKTKHFLSYNWNTFVVPQLASYTTLLTTDLSKTEELQRFYSRMESLLRGLQFDAHQVLDGKAGTNSTPYLEFQKLMLLGQDVQIAREADQNLLAALYLGARPLWDVLGVGLRDVLSGKDGYLTTDDVIRMIIDEGETPEEIAKEMSRRRKLMMAKLEALEVLTYKPSVPEIDIWVKRLQIVEDYYFQPSALR